VTRGLAVVLATLLGSALVLAPLQADAKCAMALLDHVVVAHAGDVIPAGGGVLVGWQESRDYDAGLSGSGDPAMNPGWKFRVRKRNLAARATQLAPGLVVYTPVRLPKGRQIGVQLIGAKGVRIGTFKFGKKTPGITEAPSPKTLTVTHRQNFRSTKTDGVVELDAPPPKGAYGLVMYEVTASGAPAIAWGPVMDSAATTITVYDGPGRCGTEPDGMRAPAGGAVVELAWVDRFGRLSPRSAQVTVDEVR
jgi:hypothetical protein